MSRGCTLPKRPDGTPYLERTCASCGARITYTGTTAEVANTDAGPSLSYCDAICAPMMRWDRPRGWMSIRDDRQKQIKARRVLVAEGRR